MLEQALDFYNFMVVLGVRTILPLIASNDEQFIPGWLQACTHMLVLDFTVANAYARCLFCIDLTILREVDVCP
jgi:hypothetical protein